MNYLHKTRFSILAVLFYILLIQPFAFAASPRNLALHKKLDYAPKPEYHLTVHPRDPFKLTDGIKDQSLWYESYREKTVGWGWKIASLIEITIDLGQVYNVGFINLYTVGGGQSDIEYPEYAIAAGSIDGNQYDFSSFATSDGWVFGTNKAIPKTIVLPVEQRVRYIKLYIRPIGSYFFTDEIEVIESQSPELDSLSRDYLSKDQIFNLVERARQVKRERDVLSEKVGKSSQSADELTGGWQAMKENISQLGRNLTEEKVSKREAEVAHFRAKWLQSEYKTEWLCYPAEPMDILRYGDLPENVSDNFEISLYQWKNEHGITAINLVNCSNSQIMFKVNLSPLRFQDRVIDSKDVFELRRAVYVRVLDAGLVADPLVLQNSKPFSVAAGQTVQLWLGTYSKGLDAGAYTAAMAIDASGENISKTQHVVPIKLEVANRIFSDKIPFFSCNWDYIAKNDTFTRRDPENAVADLKSHYINVSVILPGNIYGNRGTELAGRYILPSKLEPELKLYKDSSIILLWLGMDWRLRDHFGEFKTSDGEYNIVWKNNFKSFLGELVSFMLDKGYNYESFVLYLYDEYIGDDFIYVARIIKEFDPRLKIYANKWIEPGEVNKVKDIIDIWCPHIPDVLANKNNYDYYRNMKIFDQVWCYHSSIACERFFAPTKTRTSREWRGENRSFWRTMPIVAASLGMTGSGFWVYQDSDRTGWIKDQIGNHGVVYDGTQNPDKDCFPEMIIPSKRWQQWREGIEDAVCLSGHQELLNEFFSTSSSKLSSECLYSLRRRADEIRDTPK